MVIGLDESRGFIILIIIYVITCVFVFPVCCNFFLDFFRDFEDLFETSFIFQKRKRKIETAFRLLCRPPECLL